MNIMKQTLAIALLGLFLGANAQNFDGCGKNCLLCWKNPAPAVAGQIQKTCYVCMNSSPKESTTLPGFFDCSGSEIANCETHLRNILTGKVTCGNCRAGYMKKTDPSGEICVALTAEYENCALGGLDRCQNCKQNFIIPVSGSKKCDAIPEADKIQNCNNYAKVVTATTCKECNDGFTLSGNACTATPAEQLDCLTNYQKEGDQVTCGLCNYKRGLTSIDAQAKAGDTIITPQRQICGKSGGGAFLIIIIILLIVVVVVVVVLVMKSKSNSASSEKDMKDSMI